MNPEQALAHIALILLDARPANAGTYNLQIYEHQVHLNKSSDPHGTEGILAHLISKDINNGLTTRMWNQIHDRFAIFQKRGLI